MISPPVQLKGGWREVLRPAWETDYFRELQAQLTAQQAAGKVIYPAVADIFRAFDLCPLGKVKVVILGQDPYHGPGQANGLCFSVPEGVALPPSLRNIFKALALDLGQPIPQSGNLSHWAQQGVLLLNSILTVCAGEAAAHRNFGWERFTDQVIATVSEHCESVVFLLWGSYAINKSTAINPAKHLILTAAHPSPLSAHRGFIECKHFSLTNEWLQARGLEAINW